ncbi:hypothetical protein PAAG_04453 [Paracoccidioides lutzii Pb01]|uniref:Uncharacterized protein n=1 Tax=Paracoccidioides lutzii (strain ATCC MYA-826 / Pb01) TaxID=502779 RepID=C1H109_PARBA|nr:hypothetical protein PAAG_04453 [Paracoccidioides lutzii Pb01]EEH33403.2 hypothetical protein PAAG_04453 [Paracoccidioides lutzii Pb01]
MAAMFKQQKFLPVVRIIASFATDQAALSRNTLRMDRLGRKRYQFGAEQTRRYDKSFDKGLNQWFEGKRGGSEWIRQIQESGHTTEQNHENSTKKMKEEFPEAPDPIIGMTDERGKIVLLGLGFLKVLEKNVT